MASVGEVGHKEKGSWVLEAYFLKIWDLITRVYPFCENEAWCALVYVFLYISVKK